jgi:Zn-dependent M28 family amino/carboxypeptidase
MSETVIGRRVAVLMVAVAVVAGCSDDGDAGAPVDPAALADSVQIDALVGHLTQLERIATEHDGNRALGTGGYDASVDYVAGALRDAGFDVQTPEFDATMFQAGAQTLEVDGQPLDVRALGLSPTTGPDGLVAPVVRVPADDSPGCEPTDYGGLDVAGRIAVVDRGVCTFSTKEALAADAGAAALLVVNTEEGPLAGATLDEAVERRIPVGGISGTDGDRIAAASSVDLVLDTKTETHRSRNVVAQTVSGSSDDVVVVGAHLDSVPEGPGINDNGSGVAAVLETALQLGSEPGVTNAVRFAFWGAEEIGLVGSSEYIASLSPEERDAIALYLNFDMIGSPNPGYLLYDGDDSDGEGAGPGPEGSAGIERTFSRFFTERGIDAGGTDFDGRSDYGPFIEVGIPSGGTFTGADEVKSPDEADKWGGIADEDYDSNYHGPEDTLDNIDRDAFAVAGASVAYGTAVYALSLDGPDGVPSGAARTEARAAFTE